ncbi:MAG: Gfo/Idh/MocA family protein [Candidatus Caldatribacteriaceae bacterium]
MFRAGIVGTGGMGILHQQALTKLGIPVVAIMSRRKEAGLVTAQRINALYCQTIDELVKAGIDMAIVATPTESHGQIVVELIERGVKCIFCEKPLTRTWEEAKKIHELCEKKRIALGIGYKMRFEKGFQTVKERLDREEIGKLHFLTFNYFQTTPPQPWYLESGVVHEILSHVIDLSNWVAGIPLEVFCQTQNFQGGAGEDRASLIVNYQHGPVATINGGWISEYPERPGKQLRNICFQLVGEKGYIAGVRGLKLFLCQGDREETVEIHPVDAVVEELKAFFEAASKNQPPPVGLKEGISAQAVIEAALQSAQSGKKEKVPQL